MTIDDDWGVTYFAWVLMMIERMPRRSPAQRGLHEQALASLEMRVVEAHRQRAACRDLDVFAATRVRPWSATTLV